MYLILCFVVLFALGQGIELRKYFNSEDGSLYYIEKELKYNWYEAWNECARKNMSLIAIDTYERHLQIDALLKKTSPLSPKVWLGGHDMAMDKRYEWISTGEVFTFTNWGSSQPDRSGNNEHCVLISENQWDWNDLPCATGKLGFICEENRLMKIKQREIDALKQDCVKDKRNNPNYSFLINPFLYATSGATLEQFLEAGKFNKTLK